VKRRYVWALIGVSYHDAFYDTEQCNVDDIKVRRHGNKPPLFRRLCKHCAEQMAYQEAQR
jgi:hypothetical protein